MSKPYVFFEITSRTFQERFLLKPSRQLNSLLLGVIGFALSKPEFSSIHLHTFKFASDHFHILLSGPDQATISAFVGFIKSNMAREANLVTGWNARFWSRRFDQIPVLDQESLVGKVRYILSHGCKENLVMRPADWPGISCEQALARGKKLKGVWYDRTAYHEARRKGKQVTLEDFATVYEVPLQPLPFLKGMPRCQVHNFYRDMLADIEAETRERHRREKTRPLGTAKVLAEDPFDRPRNPKRGPAPLCHASSAEAREEYIGLYRAFVAAYRLAAAKLRQGVATVTFPENCFPPPLPARGFSFSGVPP